MPMIAPISSDIFVRRILKPLIWAGGLAPAIWLAWRAWLVFHGQADALGVNPVAYLNQYLGDWALRFLLVALALTPIRLITGWNKLVRVRRLVGLFAFFYVVLHLSSYIGIDQFFDWRAIWLDVIKRTYITVGMGSFIILVALAATSTRGMIKRLGGGRWNLLHKTVYAAGILACLHFYMMRKGVQLEPIIYAGILLVLLIVRGLYRLKRR